MAAHKVRMLAVAPLLGGALVVLCTAPAAGQKLDTPVLSCGASGSVTIEVEVCAPVANGGKPNLGTGAPAGFSVQWMTAAAYAENDYTWYLSDDPRLCKASFSGVPCSKRSNCVNRFSLGPGECTTVELGNLFDEEIGLSSNCLGDLLCGTNYVMRAFAHASSIPLKRKRSEFTVDLACSTTACTGQAEACTLTQGYWKTHCGSAYGCVAGQGVDAWPVSSLAVGSTVYGKWNLLNILNKPAAGNGLIALAHQVIAAKLNIANGADPSAIAAMLADAEALIDTATLIIGCLPANNKIPPVGCGFLKPGVTSTYNDTLENYNSGLIGPGHCDSIEVLPVP